MKAHLLRPDLAPAPAALNVYHLERRFHTEFGVPAPPLAQWPARKVHDYVLIQQALDEVEREQQASNAPTSPGQPAPAGNAGATEQAYQQMKAKAAPPPMPPGMPPPT